MLLSGYHGTRTEENAKIIMNTQEFKLSAGDGEWLGTGIYFYFDVNDAFDWYSSPSVIQAFVKVDTTEFIDIDSPQGQSEFKRILDFICDVQNIRVKGTISERQCAVMNMIWGSNPQIKVIAASFRKGKRVFTTLTDTRPLRREFCVRDNSCVMKPSLRLLRRSDFYE